MKIDTELIQKIATLAHLELTEEEVKTFKKDFKEILNTFSILDRIDVKGTKSSFRPLEQKNILREDKIKPSLTQKETLSFTKDHKDGFFIGQKTIE